MNKIKIRFFIGVFAVMVFVGVALGILYQENAKRLVRQQQSHAQYLEQLREMDRNRQVYFDEIAKQREVYRTEMRAAYKEYEHLLKEQPRVIADKQKATQQTDTSSQTATSSKKPKTVTTKKTVTATKPQAVTVTKPKTTTTTKTS